MIPPPVYKEFSAECRRQSIGTSWIWVGVIRGLVSVKLLGSLKINRYWRLININIIKNKIHSYKSLEVT